MGSGQTADKSGLNRPPRTERKADRVADHLLRQIVAGEVAVGSLLPKEAELAAEHGVNRSVVREAIKLLEVHRLVRPVKRRGTVVLDPVASFSPEVLQAMMVPSPGQVQPDRLRDFLEIRESLDVQMSVLAATRRTDADLEALDAHVPVLRDALGDRDRYNREADAFSRSVARAAHNRIFEMLVWWNQEVATELQYIFDAVRPANEPHLMGVQLLIQLIRAKDSDAIGSLVTTFHQWASPRVMAAAALSSGAALEELGIVDKERTRR